MSSYETCYSSVVRPHRLATILTHNRHELLARCVAALRPQVHALLVIDNASDPPVESSVAYTLRRELEQPPNLARLMNYGFDHWATYVADVAVVRETTRWDVATVCDDVEVPAGWFEAVAGELRAWNAAAASSGGRQDAVIVKQVPDGDIFNRMQGAAFVMRGELGLRADERMRWWWQDTDLDWQARGAGGTVIVPGYEAVNSRPNDFTYSVPGLGEQAGRDGEVFAAKWGGRPW